MGLNFASGLIYILKNKKKKKKGGAGEGGAGGGGERIKKKTALSSSHFMRRIKYLSSFPWHHYNKNLNLET